MTPPSRRRTKLVARAAAVFVLGLLAFGALVFVAPPRRVVQTPLLLGVPASADPGPQNPALRALGAWLFRSPLLSADGTVACTSCHDPNAGFSGQQSSGTGVAGYRTPRRPPPLVDLAAASALMWDGRATSLADQVVMPLEGAEMRVDWRAALQLMARDVVARQAFVASGRPVDRATVIEALVAYLRSLTAGGSRFDRWYYGHDATALSEQEVRGWRLFSHEARCVTCHLVGTDGATFTDGGFHATGIGYDGRRYADPGRAAVTGREADQGLFKTPSLRGVAQRRRFMHDGSLSSLRAVLAFYNNGCVAGAPNLDTRLVPLHLDPLQIDDLLAFLSALDAPLRSF